MPIPPGVFGAIANAGDIARNSNPSSIWTGRSVLDQVKDALKPAIGHLSSQGVQVPTVHPHAPPEELIAAVYKAVLELDLR